MPKLENQTRKFVEGETDADNPITQGLIVDMAATLNAFCDFLDIKCTLFTENGTYLTKNTNSRLLIFGVGGGGGGGSGSNGKLFMANYDFSFGSNQPLVFPVRPGNAGTDGGDSFFGGIPVGKGGRGGFQGWIGQLEDDFAADSDRRQLVELFDTIATNNMLFGHYINGTEFGSGGAGSAGDRARSVTGQISGSVSVLFADHETGAFADIDEDGHHGHHGEPGRLGVTCLDAAPTTQYDIIVGQGGTGGAGYETETFTFDADWVTNKLAVYDFTKPGGGDADDGINGAVLVYELGF